MRPHQLDIDREFKSLLDQLAHSPGLAPVAEMITNAQALQKELVEKDIEDIKKPREGTALIETHNFSNKPTYKRVKLIKVTVHHIITEEHGHEVKYDKRGHPLNAGSYSRGPHIEEEECKRLRAEFEEAKKPAKKGGKKK